MIISQLLSSSSYNYCYGDDDDDHHHGDHDDCNVDHQCSPQVQMQRWDGAAATVSGFSISAQTFKLFYIFKLLTFHTCHD